MKKFVCLFTIFVLILSGIGAVGTIGFDKFSYVEKEKLVFSETFFEEIEGYYKPIINDCNSFISEPGKPFLPMKTQVFYLPKDVKIKDITFISLIKRLFLLVKFIILVNLMKLS